MKRTSSSNCDTKPRRRTSYLASMVFALLCLHAADAARSRRRRRAALPRMAQATARSATHCRRTPLEAAGAWFVAAEINAFAYH